MDIAIRWNDGPDESHTPSGHVGNPPSISVSKTVVTVNVPEAQVVGTLTGEERVQQAFDKVMAALDKSFTTKVALRSSTASLCDKLNGPAKAA